MTEMKHITLDPIVIKRTLGQDDDRIIKDSLNPKDHLMDEYSLIVDGYLKDAATAILVPSIKKVVLKFHHNQYWAVFISASKRKVLLPLGERDSTAYLFYTTLRDVYTSKITLVVCHNYLLRLALWSVGLGKCY